MAKFSGSSTAATGTITANTASKLSFAEPKKYVIIENLSGKRAYIKINDAGLTVSPTAKDISRADGEALVLEDVTVENITVYVDATSGITMVGW